MPQSQELFNIVLGIVAFLEAGGLIGPSRAQEILHGEVTK